MGARTEAGDRVRALFRAIRDAYVELTTAAPNQQLLRKKELEMLFEGQGCLYLACIHESAKLYKYGCSANLQKRNLAHRSHFKPPFSYRLEMAWKADQPPDAEENFKDDPLIREIHEAVEIGGTVHREIIRLPDHVDKGLLVVALLVGVHTLYNVWHSAVCNVLRGRGADVNGKDDKGLTALHRAAMAGRSAVCNVLLGRGADVNAKDGEGKTALFRAAMGGKSAACNVLLGRGADVNATDDKGLTALHWAAMAGRIAVCELLLGHGADVNAKDDKGQTALHSAAYIGTSAVVCELLLGRCADVNAKDDKGRTALYSTVAAGHSAVSELLLGRGADVIVFEVCGLTNYLCGLAIREDRMLLFRMLLEQGHVGHILRPGLAVSGPKCARLAWKLRRLLG
ncbi:hypothetical protein KFL_006520040 [Klebsormidium nitens]|uniref:Uncharacterized protein n=1 Tax=Klebsormidium nitens TaxID=105231 RepID=A0A1Y1IQW2_KLENI|nr:hypothetical protein KFL_006520040 [Klebsormidium nitens]|eukprot:GAQ90528.1 hypothetical protein KFL_006520040 [Klebsormidium nitens]